MKLSPEAERLGAQVLLCQEQTLPLDPQGLYRGADPCKLVRVGCALLHPAGARGMCLWVSVSDLASLASAGGSRAGASAAGYKRAQRGLVQGVFGCRAALD